MANPKNNDRNCPMMDMKPPAAAIGHKSMIVDEEAGLSIGRSPEGEIRQPPLDDDDELLQAKRRVRYPKGKQDKGKGRGGSSANLSGSAVGATTVAGAVARASAEGEDSLPQAKRLVPYPKMGKHKQCIDKGKGGKDRRTESFAGAVPVLAVASISRSTAFTTTHPGAQAANNPPVTKKGLRGSKKEGSPASTATHPETQAATPPSATEQDSSTNGPPNVPAPPLPNGDEGEVALPPRDEEILQSESEKAVTLVEATLVDANADSTNIVEATAVDPALEQQAKRRKLCGIGALLILVLVIGIGVGGVGSSGTKEQEEQVPSSAPSTAMGIAPMLESGVGVGSAGTKEQEERALSSTPSASPTTGCLASGTCCINGARCNHGYANDLTVSLGSCDGDKACLNAGLAGSATIGVDSCVSPRACWNLGEKSNSFAIVGDSSCRGYSGCHSAGAQPGGSFIVGAGSCQGIEACYYAGYHGFTTIGSNSCINKNACNRVGQLNGNGGIGHFEVGDSSCVGEGSCENAARHGHVTIGSNSCNGDNACFKVGKNIGDKVIIGDWSCNCDNCCSCLQDGAVVPDGHCNSLGEYQCCKAPTAAPTFENPSGVPCLAGFWHSVVEFTQTGRYFSFKNTAYEGSGWSGGQGAINGNKLLVTFSDGGKLTGTVSSDWQQIEWSNRSFWDRDSTVSCASPTPAPTTSGYFGRRALEGEQPHWLI